MAKAAYDDSRVILNLYKKRGVNSNGCWEWTGALLSSGYGTCKYKSKQVLVHRLSAYLLKKIPLTCEVIIHECDNKKCFNPDHLREGTQRENMIDMKSKGRTRSAIGEQ